MSEASELRTRYEQVVDRIGAAASKVGVDPERVILVAVSKYAATDQIRTLIEMGHQDFGENKVQQLTQRVAMVEEYLDRIRVLPHVRAGRRAAQLLGGPASSSAGASGGSDETEPSKSIRWHMIGRLQRNKARKAAESCRLIQTVDSLRLAEELQSIGMRRNLDVDVLLQVNCSGEEQKSGCLLPAAPHLAEQIDQMGHVHLRGVMTMAAATDNPEAARPAFQRCREVFEDIRRSGFGGRCNILSMGMSNDFEVAIEEGANLIRVGSAIFGDYEAEPDDEAEAPEA
ncbi:MAG: YggS family pyridoxal phosphate-dependent enzyme [Planctomycetota bacterium]